MVSGTPVSEQAFARPIKLKTDRSMRDIFFDRNNSKLKKFWKVFMSIQTHTLDFEMIQS